MVWRQMHNNAVWFLNPSHPRNYWFFFLPFKFLMKTSWVLISVIAIILWIIFDSGQILQLKRMNLPTWLGTGWERKVGALKVWSDDHWSWGHYVLHLVSYRGVHTSTNIPTVWEICLLKMCHTNLPQIQIPFDFNWENGGVQKEKCEMSFRFPTMCPFQCVHCSPMYYYKFYKRQ